MQAERSSLSGTYSLADTGRLVSCGQNREVGGKNPECRNSVVPV